MQSTAITAIVAALSAAAGAAAALWVGDEPPAVPPPAAPDAGEVIELRNRIAQLEGRLEGLSTTTTVFNSEPDERPRAVAQRSEEAQPVPATREDRANAWRRSQERREQREREQLLAAGWTEPEVDLVRQANEASRLQALEEQYRLGRELREKYPDLMDMFQLRSNSALRDSLGDEKYASYLEATGRPSSVNVRSVVPGSAGDVAGLRDGDRITHYDGKRVFGFSDLERATYNGDYGESVTIELVRDGTTFHIAIPRGPIGTTGRR